MGIEWDMRDLGLQDKTMDRLTQRIRKEIITKSSSHKARRINPRTKPSQWLNKNTLKISPVVRDGVKWVYSLSYL